MELILVSCCVGSSVDTWKEMHLERGFIHFEPCRIANCSSKDKISGADGHGDETGGAWLCDSER